MKPFSKKSIQPILIVTPKAEYKMKFLVQQSKQEISWHGFVKRLAENVFQLYDIILFPQSNTGATSTTDEEEYTTWLMRQMNYENYSEMRMHGHSHVNMGVTPSGVDTNYRQDMVQNLGTDDFYIFMILNKRGTKNIELYDNATHTVYETDDITYIVGNYKDIEKAKAWTEKAIKQNVKERSAVCYRSSSPKNSSIQTPSIAQYTSSDAEQLDHEWRKRWLGMEYED